MTMLSISNLHVLLTIFSWCTISSIVNSPPPGFLMLDINLDHACCLRWCILACCHHYPAHCHGSHRPAHSDQIISAEIMLLQDDILSSFSLMSVIMSGSISVVSGNGWESLIFYFRPGVDVPGPGEYKCTNPRVLLGSAERLYISG